MAIFSRDICVTCGLCYCLLARSSLWMRTASQLILPGWIKVIYKQTCLTWMMNLSKTTVETHKVSFSAGTKCYCSSPYHLRLLPTPFPFSFFGSRSLNEIFVPRPEAPDAIEELFNKSPALPRTTWTFTRRRPPSSLRVAVIERPRLQGSSAIRGTAADTETDGHETS